MNVPEAELTPSQVVAIQALIDRPTPMTLKRIAELMNDERTISREEGIAGMAQVMEIARAVIELINEDGWPSAAGPAESMECAYCRTTTNDIAKPSEHADWCGWLRVDRAINGSTGAGAI